MIHLQFKRYTFNHYLLLIDSIFANNKKDIDLSQYAMIIDNDFDCNIINMCIYL